MLTYAVEEAYHALLPGGRHPVAVIHLAVPPEDVDVNVHPAKTEVRLRRDRLAFAVVRNAVRQALADFAPVPDLQPTVVEAGDWGWGSSTVEADSAPSAGHVAANADPDAGGAGATAQPVLVEPARNAAPIVGNQPSGSEAPAGAGGAAAPRRSALRALAQVGLTYIIAEDASGMYLIDQHSAHERVVYEQLLAQARAAGSASAPPAQLLLQPDTLELNAAQSAWLREHAATLAAFGFELEPFGGHTWLLRAVPRTLATRGRSKRLGELIDAMIEREYGDGPIDDQARWAVACHSAVRAGDALAPAEMDALIDRLQRCDMRRTCPHGRPTMIHLSHAQLEREFGRR
jgi:DNA mismatch repair protein MutL